MRFFALFFSATLHVGVALAALFGGQLFQPVEDDVIEVVEAEILSEEEFLALSSPPPSEAFASIEPQQPEITETPTAPSTPDVVDAPSPALIEESALRPPPPETTPDAAAPPPPSDAPYDAAPPAPSQIAVAQEALNDRSADAEIREALPQVRVSDVASLSPDADAQESSEVATATDPQPSPPPPNLRAQQVDDAPQPDQPDTPPEPEVAEVEPEPETTRGDAPERVAQPRRRPERERQVARAEPEPEPEETETERRRNTLSVLERAVAESAAAAASQTAARTPPTPQRQRPRSRLSTTDRTGVVFALRQCWSQPDTGGVDPSTLFLEVQIELNRSGWLTGPPRLLSPRGPLTTRQEAVYRSAQAALRRCQPFPLPPEKYDAWASLIIEFDPVNESFGVQ